MIYWTIEDGEVRRAEAEAASRVVTAYGAAFVVDTGGTQVYISPRAVFTLNVFRSFLHREHAERSLKAYSMIQPAERSLKASVTIQPAQVEPPKFLTLGEVTWELQKTTKCQVGNVYPCMGGQVTHYWVVGTIRDGTAVLLGFNVIGEFTSTITYRTHVLTDHAWSRRCIGRVEGFSGLRLVV